MESKPFIKLELRPWTLSKKADNEFIADVIPNGNTLDNRAIAERIAKRLGIISADVALTVLNMRDEAALAAITCGTPVQDGIVRMTARVTGPWTGDVRKFDRNVHKVTAGFALTDRARKEFDKVGVGVHGNRPVPACIALVTDVITGRTDGFISPDGDIVIAGTRIKVAPLNSSAAVTFVDSDGALWPVTAPLALNMPKRVVARVPPMPNGVYTLHIRTFYSNASTLLKTAREIVFALPLRVEDAER
jgi:hypothetical protein